jgi:hypothetical protein
MYVYVSYVCMNVCMHVCIMCKKMYECMYVCIHIYMHTCIQVLNDLFKMYVYESNYALINAV